MLLRTNVHFAEVKVQPIVNNFSFAMDGMVKAVMPDQVTPIVNVTNVIPEQAAPVVNVNVDPTPVTVDSTVNVAPADVIIQKPKSKPVELSVTRNADGLITGVKEK